MSNSDWNDIQACLTGDQDAYARLLRRYESQVKRLMWRFTRDARQCEELTQDVFVEAYLGLAKFRGTGPFLNWLWRIATRVGYRFWKQQAKQNAIQPLSEYDNIPQSEDAFDSQIAAELLTALLEQLKPADRLILTLQYFEECSIKDIAERTGWNSAVVKMRAHRARKKLRQIADREKLLEKLPWTN